MTERPILFSGEMIRAILAGRKTQTRRVVKFETHNGQRTVSRDGRFVVLDDSMGLSWSPYGGAPMQPCPPDVVHDYCPHGKPGDALWVREKWRLCRFMDGEPVMFEYAADGARAEERHTDSLNYEEWYEKICESATDELMALKKAGHPDLSHDGDHFVWAHGKNPLKWRPSIFMPRWASRITLQVTDVRVERLRDISEDDAWDEGPSDCMGPLDIDGRVLFKGLWDSINAKRGYGWDTNPWVWVVKFEVKK